MNQEALIPSALKIPVLIRRKFNLIYDGQ